MNQLVVKVPEGCVKKAHDAGLRGELLMYYRLKALTPDGYFKNGGAKLVAAKLCISERTLWRWFKRLTVCGFMYEDKNGYGLLKYDIIYRLLGYDTTQHKRKSRNGDFKIFKIQTRHIGELITAIAKEEIATNLSRQDYMSKRKPTPTDKPDNYVSEVRGTSISCSGVGNLLGYSRTTGHRLEQKLVKLYPNTVQVEKCVEIVSFDTESYKDKLKSGGRMFKSDGIIFRTMPNKFYIH